MRVVEGLDSIDKPFERAVVTIGNFDGVHRGHQALFARVREKAKRLHGTAVALTFEPHPARVLRPDAPSPPRITLYDQKVELIAENGMDALVCIPFTRDFAALSATQFLKDILLDRIGMKAIVVGRDYAFGKNRQGDIDFLEKNAGPLDFEVVCEPWVITEGNGRMRVSSTTVRKTLTAGDVETARELLGRFYQVRGTVVSGRGRGGKTLGFPTANIELTDQLCPANGVYAVIVAYEGRALKGVANIGYSPTFDDHLFTVEVHIFDFDEQITGKPVRVDFVRRLRDEKKFSGIDELRRQIAVDAAEARRILAA
ncbi:MAG: bifunctional riboflavin kinase/FAD synthetase [Thermodesulfobacteriota bacterium]